MEVLRFVLLRHILKYFFIEVKLNFKDILKKKKSPGSIKHLDLTQ